MIRHFKSGIAGILILGCLLVAFSISMKSPIFVLGQPEVTIEVEKEGYYGLLSERLTRQLAQFGNLRIWKVDVNALSSLISSQSWVESFTVRRIIPNRVVVGINPKKISAIFLSHENLVSPIASDGSVLPEVEARLAPNVPIVRDVRFLKDPALRIRIVNLLADLAELGPLSRSSIAEIAVEKQNQFLLSLVQTGIQVRMGNENVKLKVSRVERVLEYLKTKDFEARVIDADYSNKVLVKVRHNQ